MPRSLPKKSISTIYFIQCLAVRKRDIDVPHHEQESVAEMACYDPGSGKNFVSCRHQTVSRTFLLHQNKMHQPLEPTE